MTVRPATEADLLSIAAIQDSTQHASHWHPRMYLIYDCLIAETDGMAAGFLVTREVSRETVRPEREILNLAVASSHLRKGVGSALLAAEFSRGPGSWFLEVRASNVTAQAFYQTHDFKEVGVRKDYYSDPCESAIVMRRFS